MSSSSVQKLQMTLCILAGEAKLYIDGIEGIKTLALKREIMSKPENRMRFYEVLYLSKQNLLSQFLALPKPDERPRFFCWVDEEEDTPLVKWPRPNMSFD